MSYSLHKIHVYFLFYRPACRYKKVIKLLYQKHLLMKSHIVAE